MKKFKQFLKCAVLTYLLGVILPPTPILMVVLLETMLDFGLDILLAILLFIIATSLVIFILRFIVLKLLKLCRQLQIKKIYIVLSGTACFLLGVYTLIIVLSQLLIIS